jgi:hypothetical protein
MTGRPDVTTVLVGGIGVPPDAQALFAQRRGWPLYGDALACDGPPPELPGGWRMALLLAQVDADHLRWALNLPLLVCIEAGTENDCGAFGPDLTFAVVLSSRTAFRVDPATAIIDALVGQGRLPEDRRPDCQLSLWEAISNGLIHGNLELSWSDKSLDTFLQQAADIESRLASDDYGTRPLTILVSEKSGVIEIAVTDNGPGFTQTAPTPTPDDEAAVGGLGLSLIQQHADSVRIEDGGRTTILQYRQTAKADPLG